MIKYNRRKRLKKKQSNLQQSNNTNYPPSQHYHHTSLLLPTSLKHQHLPLSLSNKYKIIATPFDYDSIRNNNKLSLNLTKKILEIHHNVYFAKPKDIALFYLITQEIINL